MKLLIMHFLQPFVTFFLLSTLFSNTHNLCSSLLMTDQVSHPYKTDKVWFCVWYFNLYIYGYEMGRQKTELFGRKHSPDLNN
jgi:hypothetical protein